MKTYKENLEQEHYFHVKFVDGKPNINGEKKCLLGHIIDNGFDGEREGVFVEWEWDGSTLHVVTDKFAFYPVYYWCGNEEFAISTSIMKLFELGAPKELDNVGLTIFSRLGFHIGEYTCFSNVKALPPGADLRWSQHQISINKHITIEKVINIKRDDAIEKYIHLFRKSIQKRLPKNSDFVTPLSGGRDSRHILLELVHQGCRPKFCVTHEQFSGKSFGEDIRTASLLCRALGTQHVILDQTEKYSKVERRKNYHTNFCTDEHQQSYVMADYIFDKTHILYDGIAGDILSENSFRNVRYSKLYKEKKYEELAIECLRRFSCEEKYFRVLFHKKFYARINYDLAIAELASELRKFEQAADPFAEFLFWNRTRREIALLPYRVLERVPKVYTPYLDYELQRFLSSLPEDIVKDGKFHTDTIHRAYPQYANVPFENKKSGEVQPEVIKTFAELNKEIALYYLSQFNFRNLTWNKKYLLPRMMRCLVSSKYAAGLIWLPLNRIIHLTQLVNLCAQESEV